MSIPKSTSQRIAMIRFVMIFGVVMLHTPLYVAIKDTGPSAFDFVKAFFQQSLFRLTVPVMSFISGYLLYASHADYQFGKMLVKKFHTLVIPFLVFNLTTLVGMYFAEKYLHFSGSYNLLTADMHTWLNAAFGLTDMPINYPLHFVRDLIVLMFLVPLFGGLLRNFPYLGLIFIVMFFQQDYELSLVLSNDMPVLFYLGGLVAVKEWDLRKLDRYAPTAAIILVALCALIVIFRINKTVYLGYVSPFLLFPTFKLLENTKIGQWFEKMSKYSFFLYIAHAPVLYLTWVVYNHYNTHIPYTLYWIVAPVVTTTIVIVSYRLGMAILPKSFAYITATKTSTSVQFVERRKMPRSTYMQPYTPSERLMMFEVEKSLT